MSEPNLLFSLVLDYLERVMSPSLAEEFKVTVTVIVFLTSFIFANQSLHSSTSSTRPEIRASIEVMVEHFVKTAPAKRKLSLGREGRSKKIKKTVETETSSGE